MLLLEWKLFDMKSICEKIIEHTSSQEETPLEIPAGDLNIYSTLFGRQDACTLHLTTKGSQWISKTGSLLALCAKHADKSASRK